MIKIKNYRNLIKTIALTDFKLRYEGSVLGYLWSLMKPMLLFGVMYFVFSYVFKIGGGIPHYPVYLLTGIVIWSFFTEASNTLMGSVAGKAHVIRKVYFPRIVLPIANSFTSILILASNMLIVAAFMAANGIVPSWKIVFLPLLFVELYVFVLGVGLLLASLYVKFRDISHIWEVLMQAMFYATPILYSPARLPELAKKILILNPAAQIIQDVREVLISPETISASDILTAKYLWIPYVIPVIAFVLGYYVFEKSAARFAEEV